MQSISIDVTYIHRSSLRCSIFKIIKGLCPENHPLGAQAAAIISGDFLLFQQFLNSPTATGKPENW